MIRGPGMSTTFIEAEWSITMMDEAEKMMRDLEVKSIKSGSSSRSNYYILITRKLDDVSTSHYINEARIILVIGLIEKLMNHDTI